MMRSSLWSLPAAIALGGGVTVQAVADEIPLDPGTEFRLFTQNTNDGYASFRGMVFTANENLTLDSLGLYTKKASGALNATFEVWKVVVTRGDVHQGATKIGQGTGQLTGALEFHNLDLDAPVALVAGSHYHVRVGYPDAAEENWFYEFDPVFFGDPPVNIGPVTLIDGTLGSDTSNFVAPFMQLITSGATCHYTITKSKGKGGCRNCPNRGDDLETQEGCENVEDCRKKVKTTINCLEGEGTCKIKGKRSSCG